MEVEAEEIKTLPRAIDSNAFFVSMVCGLGLAGPASTPQTSYLISLALCVSSGLFECPIVIFLYNHCRRDAEQSSYMGAVGQGLLGLRVGAIANSFGAIVLGAPVGIQPSGFIEYMICLPAQGEQSSVLGLALGLRKAMAMAGMEYLRELQALARYSAEITASLASHQQVQPFKRD